jgi:hypothetical protein
LNYVSSSLDDVTAKEDFDVSASWLWMTESNLELEIRVSQLRGTELQESTSCACAEISASSLLAAVFSVAPSLPINLTTNPKSKRAQEISRSRHARNS